MEPPWIIIHIVVHPAPCQVWLKIFLYMHQAFKYFQFKFFPLIKKPHFTVTQKCMLKLLFYILILEIRRQVTELNKDTHF